MIIIIGQLVNRNGKSSTYPFAFVGIMGRAKNNTDGTVIKAVFGNSRILATKIEFIIV